MLTTSRASQRLVVHRIIAAPPPRPIRSSKAGNLLGCVCRPISVLHSPCRRFPARSSVQTSQDNKPLRRHRSSELYAAASFRQPPHRLMATGASSGASLLREVITLELLGEVRKTWFEHCPSDEQLVLPDKDTMSKWYRRDEEFDRICVSRFVDALEKVKTSGAGGDEVIQAVEPSSPLDWMSLVILFDQIPRNAYRGPESGVVFTVFDPIARVITTRASEAGVPLHPEIRYRIAYRMWFAMPLMHSEDVSSHELAVEQIQAMVDDVRDADQDPGFSTAEGDELECRKILAAQKEAAVAVCENQLGFETRHQAIIERFGRYPHRNAALGRTPTREETEYLENGGDTFG